MQCAIVELRQYTLHPGRRDELIELFEREFLETQEAVGMTLLGQFRDVGQSDRFVWLRGFADMESRAASLAAFYDGPVWAAHRTAANATMLDSDDVLLLRPAREGSGLETSSGEPFPNGAPGQPHRIYLAGVHSLSEPAREADIARIDASISPACDAAGGAILAWYVSEARPNTYPRLPVREGENVVVWFAAFADGASSDAFRRAQRRGDDAQLLRLEPTKRSRLR